MLASQASNPFKPPTICNQAKTARSTFRSAWTKLPKTQRCSPKPARTRGVMQRDTGITPEGIYKALGDIVLARFGLRPSAYTAKASRYSASANSITAT